MPGKNRRIAGRMLSALLASLVSIAGWTSQAGGAVAVGGELAIPFAVDSDTSAAEPALVGEATLRWWLDRLPLGLGLSVGQRQDAFVGLQSSRPEAAQLRSLLAGATLHYQLGNPRWSARPFVGTGFGYAHLTLDSTAERRQYANGLFMSPQAGLRVPLGRFELSAAARYHHLYTGYTLQTVEDRRKRHFGGIGLGLGLYARL